MAELLEGSDLILVNNVRKKRTKKGRKRKTDVEDEPMRPGMIYVGRIPHGFYEKEMNSFFSQFGQVNRIKISRNKKVGLDLELLSYTPLCYLIMVWVIIFVCQHYVGLTTITNTFLFRNRHGISEE